VCWLSHPFASSHPCLTLVSPFRPCLTHVSSFVSPLPHPLSHSLSHPCLTLCLSWCAEESHLQVGRVGHTQVCRSPPGSAVHSKGRTQALCQEVCPRSGHFCVGHPSSLPRRRGISLSLSLSVSGSPSVSCLCLSLSVCVCVSLSRPVSVSVSVSLGLCLSVSSLSNGKCVCSADRFY